MAGLHMTGASVPHERRGPEVEIKRGAWEDRFREIDRAARAELLGSGHAGEPPPRWALLIEPGTDSGRLVSAVRPLLGDDALAIGAAAAPLKLSAHLPSLKTAHEAEPLVGICVVGTGDRADARRAAWDLGALATRPWVFAHTLAPASGLVPTIGEKVVRYLEVIEGLAFSEGPRPNRY